MKQVYPITIQSGMSQSGSYVLMLCEPESEIQVPIIIGQYEAQSILLARENIKTGRPMTHQLIADIMDTFGLHLTRVTVDKLVEGVFHSTLHITDGFNEHHLDSRTSDAVALALLSDTPIFMDDNVLTDAGMQNNSDHTDTDIDALEAQLHLCEENEEYERAAEIQAKIDKLRSHNPKP